MFEEYTDILTAQEAGEALRIGDNALYALLGSGKLKGYRNGPPVHPGPGRAERIIGPIWEV